MKRALKVFALVVVAMAVALPAASAHSGTAQRLKRFVSGDAAARWQSQTVDSPLDANKGRYRLEVAEQSGDDYVLLYESGSGVGVQRVSTVRNLSFDFLSTAYVGAGAPRISVDISTNGDRIAEFSVFLAAFHCNNAIGGSVWHRADFTGELDAGACTVWAEGLPYTSNGTQSAWDVFADAYAPGDRVLDAYVVMDEAGVSYVDNIAFHNHSFGRGPSPQTGKQFITHCPSEAAC
jgi:predicted small secreted protein